METTQLKICSQCKLEKSINEFHFRKDTQKYRNQCKHCISIKNKQYRDENKDKISHNKKEYARKNRDKISDYQKEYRIKNKDSIRENQKRWEINNPYARRKSYMKYVENNRELINKKYKEYSKTPQGIKARKVSWHNRSKKLRGAGGKLRAEDIAKMMENQKHRCVYCNKGIKHKYHIDHINPISKGGTNYIENIQLLCPTCNLKKSDKDPLKFANELGRLL